MAYKINNEAIVQDDSRVFNNGCTYISEGLQNPVDDSGFYWGSNATLRAASGNYEHPATRVAAITNPLTGYAVGDTNNNGSLDLTDQLNFVKYAIGLSTPPDTLYYANRFIGPAPSNGFNQSDEDAGGYLVGWSDEDAYRVLELYVNSGTPAWVTQAFTDSNIAAYADIDDNGSINSSDLTAARNVINGSTTNTAQNANFYKFKALVCGKFFKTSSSSTSAMWGRGLIGRGDGFNYLSYNDIGTVTPAVRQISGQQVDTKRLVIHREDADGNDFSTTYGLYGPQGNTSYETYDASGVANITVSLPQVFKDNGRKGVVRVDFYFFPVNNGPLLYIDPQDASSNQINVDVNYRSSWSGADAGSYYNNNSGGIRTSNYGVKATSPIAGSMYIYAIGSYPSFSLQAGFIYNGNYYMQAFSVGRMLATDLDKLKFRFNSGNIALASITATPIGELKY